MVLSMAVKDWNISMLNGYNDGEAIWSKAPGKQGRQEPCASYRPLKNQQVHNLTKSSKFAAADQSSWVNQYHPNNRENDEKWIFL